MELEKFEKEGAIYYRLFVSCPVCMIEGYNNLRQHWFHNDCGGEIYIGNNAHFFCNKCNSEVHVLESDFFCAEHATTKSKICLIDFKRTAKSREFTCTPFGQNIQITGTAWQLIFLENLAK